MLYLFTIKVIIRIQRCLEEDKKRGRKQWVLQPLKPSEPTDAGGDDAAELHVGQVTATEQGGIRRSTLVEKTQRRERERESKHGADGEVGEVAGDAEPGARIGVGGPPAPQHLLGVVETQLEFQQRFSCQPKPSPSSSPH